MKEPFTAREVRETAIGLIDMPDTACMLHAFADRLEADEKAEAVDVGTWLCGKLMDWCRKRHIPPSNENDLLAIVEDARKQFSPFSHPSPSDAERLAEAPSISTEAAASLVGAELHERFKGKRVRLVVEE